MIKDQDTFECGYCDRSFGSQNALYAHMQSHQDILKAEADCPYCDEVFCAGGKQKARQKVLNHWSKEHQDRPKPYVRCLECGKLFKMIEGRHLKSCSNITNDKYKQKHPKAQLASELTRVELSGDNEILYENCPYCDKKFKSRQEVLDHWKDDHSGEPKPYVRCKVCKRLFEYITAGHLKKHNTTMESYKREFPDASIASEKTRIKLADNYQPMLEGMREMSKKYVNCPICDQKVTIQGRYMHFRNNHPDKDYYKYKINFESTDPPPPQIVCPYCSKHLETREECLAHWKEHHPHKPKPYVRCQECGELFGQIDLIHLRTHGLTRDKYKSKRPNAQLVSQKFRVDESKAKTGENNPMKDPKVVKKQAKSLRDHYKNHEHWAKGETKETNDSVANMAKSLKEHYKNHDQWCEGKTKETSEKVAQMAMSVREFHEEHPDFFKGREPTYPKPYYVPELCHYIRSSWEEEIGLLLKRNRYDYKYEKKFELEDGRVYWADFTVGHTVIEPHAPISNKDGKFEAFHEQYPEYTFIILSPKDYSDVCDVYIPWDDRQQLINILGTKQTKRYKDLDAVFG